MLPEDDELVAAARALDEAFIHHASAGRVDQVLAAFYADDALVLPPNLPRVQGHGQIRELFHEMLEAGAGDLARETTPLHAVGDLGYAIGTYTFTLRAAEGGAGHDFGKCLLVYRRQADATW
jgi:ketosteroid isomerase-like protein